MKDHVGKIVVGLIVLVIVVWAGVFFATHKWVQTTVFYPNQDALKHPYTATELLLSNDTRQVSYLQDGSDNLADTWADIDTAPTKSVILLNVDSSQASQFDDMIAWVQAGGHLILFSDSEFVESDSDSNNPTNKDAPIDKTSEDWQDYAEQENPFLIHLGIYNKGLDWDVLNAEASASYSFDVPMQVDGQVLVMSGESRLFVADDFLTTFKDAKPYDYYAKSLTNKDTISTLDTKNQLTDSDKAELVQFVNKAPYLTNPHRAVFDSSLGQGRITVFQDGYRLDNPNPIKKDDFTKDASTNTPAKDSKPRWWQLLRADDTQDSGWAYIGGIMYKDGAYFLDYLTKERKEVQIIPYFKNKNILTLMSKHTPFLTWALGLGLVVILLRLPRQAGRQELIAKSDGSDVLAYLSGVGTYLWESDLCLRQVSANRTNLLDKIHAKIPAAHTAMTEQKCILIAKDSGLSAKQVYLALYETWDNEDEFLAMSQAFAALAQVYE